MDRRTFLTQTAASCAALSLGLTKGFTPTSAHAGTGTDWLTLAGTSISETTPTELRIAGRIPADLTGTLFRNGPGLFERDGYRKANILDGDGLVQRLHIADGKAIHQAQFVRTPKYLAEEEAGTFLRATWTTRAPGGFLNNLGASSFETQAGVTAYPVNGRLFALDEVSPIYELDPETLATIGPASSGMAAGSATKAHTKLDARTGDWITMGVEMGPVMKMHAAIHHMDGSVTTLPPVEAPVQVYTHDFFATENHLLVNLHPAKIGLVSFLGGMASFTDSFTWEPDQGNILAILPKDGSPAHFLEAPASWMWHAANAYEQGNTIIADFAGYSDPGHFIGEDPAFTAIMTGRRGNSGATGDLRRYVIDLDTNRIREEIIATEGFEFPSIDPRQVCYAHDRTFATMTTDGSIFHTALAAIDLTSGEVESFDFGPTAYVGEPVFAPGRGTNGWLITQVLDGKTGTSFFAILDADHVADGPVAAAHLTHHLPISFHGAWQGA